MTPFYLVFTGYPSGTGCSDPCDWDGAVSTYKDSRAHGYPARVLLLSGGRYHDNTQLADERIRREAERAGERPPLWQARDPLEEQRIRDAEDAADARDRAYEIAAYQRRAV